MSEVATNSFLNSEVIDDDFFIEIAERKLNISRDQFKLRLVFISPANGKNENFVSAVYRAKINVEMIETKEKKLVDVIIKVLGTTIERLKDMEVFKREIIMYRDVIESFEAFYKDRAQETANFGPKCIKVLSNPLEIIVLDDLKAEGFQMADRKIGLGQDETKLVLSKLAKFHAAGAVRYQKNGMIDDFLDRVTTMKNSLLRSQDQIMGFIQSFIRNLDRFTNVVKSIEGCEEIAKKIQQWDMAKFMTLFIGMTEPMQNGFRVLNHGDDWLNNFLFKYDQDGKLLDIKFIDFQLSFWGSPANDLIYFLVSSVRDDIKVKHFDDFIKHYHEQLVSSLNKLNYDKPIPTLYDVHMDLLQKSGAFGMHLMIILMVVKNNSEQELDIQKLFNNPGLKEDPFYEAANNPIYKSSLSVLIPFLDKRGFLDAFLPEIPISPYITKTREEVMNTPVKTEK